MAPSTRPITVSAPLLAALFGALAGLGTFAASAALWRAGQTRLAGLTAEGLLVLTLACLAAVVLLAQPPRRRRARVRVGTGRRIPQAWWPPEVDPVPVLVVCAGTPLVTCTAAAVLLFR